MTKWKKGTVKSVIGGITLVVVLSFVTVCGKVEKKIMGLLEQFEQSSLMKDSVKATGTVVSTAGSIKSIVSTIKIVQGIKVQVGKPQAQQKPQAQRPKEPPKRPGRQAPRVRMSAPKLAPVSQIVSSGGYCSVDATYGYYINDVTTSTKYTLNGEQRKDVFLMDNSGNPLTYTSYIGTCSGLPTDLCSSDYDPEVACSWKLESYSDYTAQKFCWIGYSEAGTISSVQVVEGENSLWIDEYGVWKYECQQQRCTTYSAEGCPLPQNITDCDMDAISGQIYSLGCSLILAGTTVRFSTSLTEDLGSCSAGDWDRNGVNEVYIYILSGEESSEDYYIYKDERGDLHIYSCINSYVNYSSSCKEFVGKCPDNLSCDYATSVSDAKSYVSGLSSTCQVVVLGETLPDGTWKSCSRYDSDGDGIDDTTTSSEWFNSSGTDISVSDTGKSYKYECIYDETTYSSSCEQYTATCTIKNDCTDLQCDTWVKTGYETPDGWVSCTRYDGDGDGIEDSTYKSVWKESGGEDIIVSDKGESYKYECTYDETTYSSSCEQYTATCTIKNDCSDLNCSTWVEAGFFKEEFSCFVQDINGDGINETYIDTKGTTGGTSEHLLVLESGRALFLGECSGDEPTTMTCKGWEGKCESIPTCSEGMSFDSVRATCSLKEVDTCTGEDDCELYISAFVNSAAEETPAGVTTCSRTIDRETGEFIRVTKVEDGYEFVEGTTASFTVSLCSAQTPEPDFEICKIDCRDKKQLSTNNVEDYVSSATEDSFKVEVRDPLISEGSLSITYNKETGITSFEGTLTTKDGKTITITIGTIAKDGTIGLSFESKDKDKVSTGTFTIKPDGSGVGTITEGTNVYAITLNAGGTTAKVCTGTQCKDFDLAKI